MHLVTYSLICAFVLVKKKNRKSLCNRNVGLTKPVKVLCELVYWDRLKN